MNEYAVLVGSVGVLIGAILVGTMGFIITIVPIFRKLRDIGCSINYASDEIKRLLAENTEQITDHRSAVEAVVLADHMEDVKLYMMKQYEALADELRGRVRFLEGQLSGRGANPGETSQTEVTRSTTVLQKDTSVQER